MSQPVVSVCMICYNQEKYMSQAIEGVLMQKTSFPVQLVIGEDCSTDGTLAICKEYASKNPDKINLLPSVKNLGAMNNFVRTLAACNGRYIAICEGDDYWTDPDKLQRQVEFLDKNAEFQFAFHDVVVHNENTKIDFYRVGDRVIDKVVDLKSVIAQNNIATASIVFRNNIDFQNLPQWFYKNGQKGDYGLVVTLAERGRGQFFPQKMSVYRVHDGGIWSGQNIDKRYIADEFFYGVLFDYFEDPDIKSVVAKKRKYANYSWGVNLIRRRQYLKGLSKVVRNFSFRNSGYLKTSLKRPLMAFKESLSVSK